ncbi:MAG TPA: DNA-directed RNA polymerase subunit omega [Acidimicrobiales bacterium]
MAQHVSTLMNPPVEDLLDKVDSKFTLVALASRRARQVNSYYNSLGEGIGVVVPPQVASVSGKPLSIAFEEVAAGKATFTRPDPEEEAALAEAAALAALEEAGEGEVVVEGEADTAPVEVEATAAPVEVAAEVGGEGSELDSDSDSASAGSGDAPTE